MRFDVVVGWMGSVRTFIFTVRYRSCVLTDSLVMFCIFPLKTECKYRFQVLLDFRYLAKSNHVHVLFFNVSPSVGGVVAVVESVIALNSS